MNQHSKIAFFKAKYKFWDFFHTISAIVLYCLPLPFLYFLEEGKDAGMHTIIFLFVIDLIALIVLTKIENGIGYAADDYCSEYMLKPILSEFFEIDSFETRGKTKNFLRNLEIFTNSDSLLTWSHFKGHYKDNEIEGLDFVGFSRGNWWIPMYGNKGHAVIIKLNNPFPGKMIMRPKTLQHIADRIIVSKFKKDHLETYPVGLSDFSYDVATNNAAATSEILTNEALLAIKDYPIERRRIPYLEIDGEYAYVFLRDHHWYNQKQMDGKNKKPTRLINSNGIWGAEDAEDIDFKMRVDWTEMKGLIDICAR